MEIAEESTKSLEKGINNPQPLSKTSAISHKKVSIVVNKPKAEIKNESLPSPKAPLQTNYTEIQKNIIT